MIVEELIKELQKYEPYEEVFIAFGDDDGIDIDEIEKGTAAVFS